MMFKSVENINNKLEKIFLLENVKIYIRLVECYCKKYNVEYEVTNQKTNFEELKSIGVISTQADIALLESYLGDLFLDFIKASNFINENKDITNNLVDKLNNTKRLNLQKRNIRKNKYSLVDFFCGAGGLSLGFIQHGFNVKLANDIEDVCIQTYKYNHPEVPANKIVQGDIRDIVDNLGEYITQEVDVVVGGPPCQGFSQANRQRIIDDPRNKLYKDFIKAVKKIGPKFVVMENVKGMLKVANQVVEDYEKLILISGYTYKVSYKILNSMDFSVAQSRDRLIYIAIRSDVVDKMAITPEKIFDEIEANCKKNKLYTLGDALGDIKPLDASRVRNTNEIDSDTTGEKIGVNEYQNSNNEYLSLINMKREIPFVFNHKARYCSDLNYDIYRLLEPGNDATDEKIRDIMPYAHRNHCFKDKYYKLHANRPCRTITAHLRMDCHSHIHPYQIRSLTPREAARVQSFPDDYMFLGAYLKTYMQIGNAVPPMMARGIAGVIKKYID
ncbi:MAG: DNA cytosine methyltransferase [Eubacteriales bacterium]